VRAASVNAADCHFLRMPLPARLILGLRRPKVPVRGFDLAGQVEAVGEKVTRFKPGDEVFGTAPGTFAEYASTREDRLAPKPRRLSFGQAAAVPVAGVTALQGLRDKANLQRGQRVLIYGAGGGVGTFAVQVAKALGAHVTAVTSTRNLGLIRSLGPDQLIDYTQEDVTRSGQRYDVFFDIAATRSLGECRRVLAPNGTFVGAGAAKGSPVAVLTRLLALLALSRFVSQRMVSFVAKVGSDDLVVLAELIEAGKLSPVIDREYSLSEVPDAMRYVASGGARAKVIINVG
jgi:NADPH:quinone reductase-like Zn-dependent oxidoreductase